MGATIKKIEIEQNIGTRNIYDFIRVFSKLDKVLIEKDNRSADAKSALGLMSLCLKTNDKVDIYLWGDPMEIYNVMNNNSMFFVEVK